MIMYWKIESTWDVVVVVYYKAVSQPTKLLRPSSEIER